MSHDRRLGLVLGAGVARGWAHIGVLQALAEIGVRPDVVCGCSSGAIVGASYVTGRLDRLAERVSKLKLREVLGTLDFSLAGGGLVEGRRLISFFRDTIDDVAIETLSLAFGVVATDLMSGREQWLTSGAIIDAVRASVGLPGVLVPISTRGRWLVDGAMVNPLPVSLCRALGADVIIGVSLNGNLFSAPQREPALLEPPRPNGHSAWLRRLSLGKGFRSRRIHPEEPVLTRPKAPARPGYFDVMTRTVLIAQDFVSRVRMAADPVDMLIAPALADIGLMEFHRGAEAIAAGRAATIAASKEIMGIIERTGTRRDPS
jgi:NTE family protein